MRKVVRLCRIERFEDWANKQAKANQTTIYDNGIFWIFFLMSFAKMMIIQLLEEIQTII